MKRAVWRVVGVLWLAGACPADAAPPPAPAAASAPSPYVDRVIEGLPPAEDTPADTVTYNPSGWPRALRIESRAGTDPSRGDRWGGGVALYGLLETPAYGVLSADVQAGQGGLRPLFTLAQRAMPMNGGWQVDNEAGMQASAAPPLARQPSRIYLPGQLVQGLGTRWSGHGWVLAASSGQPGRLQGSPVAGFAPTEGRLNALAAQWNSGPWALAWQQLLARQVAAPDGGTDGSGLQDAQTSLLRLRHLQAGRDLQFSLVSNHDGSQRRSGLWLDSQGQQGRWSDGFGLYRLDTALRWAGEPMVNDSAGLYLRGGWNTLRWGLEAQLDALRSLSQPDSDGLFFSSQLRWRESRELSYQLGLGLRSYQGQGASGHGDVRWLNRWGQSNLRLGMAHDVDSRRQHSLALDQEWFTGSSLNLSTRLSHSRERSAEADRPTERRWGLASLWSHSLGAAVLRGGVQTERGDRGAYQLGANLGLNWRFASRWSLDGSFGLNRGQAATPVVLDPLAPPAQPPQPTSHRQALLVLRYEQTAGSRVNPLGGRMEDGGGQVSGVVFLDENRNGRRDAGEAAAAQVSVYLDGRYLARTDAQGRFEFPFVAAGPHVLLVLNDTLPLPWIAAGDGRVPLTVRVRDSVQLAVPVVHPGLN